jgi:putative oligomerization/nucleic acid binding protein
VSTETDTTPSARTSRGRSTAVWVALVLGAVFLLLSSFAVWVNRVALNTNVFVDTSNELIEDDAIREAVALRAVDELYASVDVKELIEEQIPKDLDPLAGVAAAGARQALYQILDRALQQPALQRLWTISLRQSHTTLVQVLESDPRVVTTTQGVVVLDLRPIVLEAAAEIGIRNEVEQRLPADAGRIEVLRSDELDTAQDAFRLLKTLAWVLPLLTLAAFGGAVWLASDKRRAIRGLGITVAVVGVLGLVAVNLVGNYVVSSLVSETETQVAAGNAWDILTELLRHSFRWLIVVGILIVTAAWLAGPSRRAVPVRRTLAPAVRNRTWAYTGLAVVTLILLVTGAVADFTRLLVVVVIAMLGAVWIESLRTMTFREFPDASAPEILADLRARASRWWSTHATKTRAPEPPLAAPTPAASGADLTARLASLAELHARGDLTDEEFAAAKARVLAGD